MRVAALQYDISSDAEENLAYVVGQLELAAERGIELVNCGGVRDTVSPYCSVPIE